MATTDPATAEFLGEKPVPAWRRYGKWPLVVALVLVILLVLSRCVFGSSATAGYATQTVQRGDLTTSVAATGKLAPTNQVTVGSQLSGLVTRVVVDVNDRVTAGQPLALIDPEQIDDQIRAGEAQLAANVASVNQARATVSEANAQLARLKGRTFYAVGGTWRALAKLHQAERAYPLHVMHGYVLSPEDVPGLARLAERAEAKALKEAEEISEARRPLLAYGALVLDEIVRLGRPREIAVSALGVREANHKVKGVWHRLQDEGRMNSSRGTGRPARAVIL